jgi:superfamily II DNA or RNA helicase
MSYEIDNFINKYEFSSDVIDRKQDYKEPVQNLLRNFISKPSPYENILLYHGVGVGKTCTSISIAEGLKEYIHNMDKKIFVLTKNKTIERNFRNELLSLCTRDTYVSNEERQTLQSKTKSDSKTEFQRKADKLINKSYTFMTYGTFVNRVLGMKQFEKDALGNNTGTKKINNVLQRKPPQDPITNLNNTVIIVDEAHNITNNDTYVALYKVLFNSYNFRLILLTATPMYDNPKQIFELSNLLNINNTNFHLPIRNDLLKQDENGRYIVEKVGSKYINKKVIKADIFNITEFGLSKLTQALYGKVSYLKSNTRTNPDVKVMGESVIPDRQGSTKVVYCNMSQYQYETYKIALQKDLGTRDGNIPGKASSMYQNSNDASTMTYPDNKYGKYGFYSTFTQKGNKFILNNNYKSVLTTELEKYSCKLYQMLQNINASQDGNIFIYSNFVSNGGTTLIKQVLLANGFSEYSGTPFKNFVVMDDNLTPDKREIYRQIFNRPDNKYGEKVRIIIGSPVVSEGITFKNVRQVHILEPWWNMSTINQIIGRAVRNKSHDALPKDQRNVQVFKYVAHYPEEPQKTCFIDKEKYILSEEKDRANKVVERRLKEIGIDCDIFRERNIISTLKDGTPECDYMTCNYECKVKKPDTTTLDKSTYNVYIETYENTFIEWCVDKIQQMFSNYFIWKLEDIINIIHKDEPRLPKEVIYTALNKITTNKLPMIDMYGRDGFVFVKGDYYIFNSIDNKTTLDSSIYSKILDFTVPKNKYTLREFFGNKLDKVKPIDNNNTQQEQKKLTKTIIDFNNKLLNTHQLVGTYRQRAIGNNVYGIFDGKFRVIDLRQDSKTSDMDVQDNRKKVTGMAVNSYEFDQLADMVNFLQIKTLRNVQEYTKKELGTLIEKHLNENSMVLK